MLGHLNSYGAVNRVFYPVAPRSRASWCFERPRRDTGKPQKQGQAPSSGLFPAALTAGRNGSALKSLADSLVHLYKSFFRLHKLLEEIHESRSRLPNSSGELSISPEELSSSLGETPISSREIGVSPEKT